MIIIDPSTGLTITCQPWEYNELCKQRGWIKTVYATSATPVQKRGFTPPEEKAELEWAKKAKEEKPRPVIANGVEYDSYADYLKSREEEK